MESHGDWPSGVLDLVLLAQAISQIREADIAMESMVQLMLVMLGGKMLLAHDGTNYVFRSGPLGCLQCNYARIRVPTRGQDVPSG